MIGERSDALIGEERRGLLGLLARQAINDAGFSRVLGADEVEQLPPRVVLFDDAIADVGAVEARHENSRLAQAQALDDFCARLRIRRRGQRDARHPAKALGEDREL